jgi:membrane-bound ClpP family serine protease
MSDEGDTFWVSLFERLIGLLLIIVGAILLYFSATTADLGGFGLFFGVISIVLVIVGLFLLLVKPPK